MKKILTSLITIYSLTFGQAPPISTTSTPATSTAGAVLNANTQSTTELNLPLNIPSTTTTTTSVPIINSINNNNINPSTTTTTISSSIPVTTSSSIPISTSTSQSLPPNTNNNIATSTSPITTTGPVTTSTPITTSTINTLSTTTTAGPAAYINPYCPAYTALEQMGQQNNMNLPLGFSLTQNAECRSNIPGDPRSRAIDFEGMLTCNNFHCCLCQEINCGASGYGCNDLQIGDSGAVGVQNIIVQGLPGLSSFMGQFGQQNGAHVDCGGLEGCKNTKIFGNYVGQMQCTGDYGCENAMIYLTDPADQMNLQCNGLMSCKGAHFEIRITRNAMIAELGTIEFNGQQSAQSAEIKIINEGYTPILIQNVECMNPTACVNIRFIIEGNIMIENCDLQGIQNLHSLPPVLQSCVLGQGNNNQFFPQMPATFPQFPQFPQTPQTPQIPQFPPYTQPTYPSPPVNNPYQPPTVPAPQVPGQVGQGQVGQTQPNPPQTQPNLPGQVGSTIPGQVGQPNLPYYGSMNGGQSLDCEFGQCLNRQITVTPANNFQLKCTNIGQCNGLQLTLNVGYDPLNSGHMVERIDSLTFSAPSSNVIVTINNAMGPYGQMIEVNDIRCEMFGSCNGLKVITSSNVEINNVDCQQPGSCIGCTVNGMSCDMLSQSTGFGSGYNLGYPYGYNNVYQPPSVNQQPPVNQQQSPFTSPQQQQSPFTSPQYQQQQPSPFSFPQWQI